MPVLLEVELRGARQVRAAMPEALSWCSWPLPSWEELERRLGGRGTEVPESSDGVWSTPASELAAARSSTCSW